MRLFQKVEGVASTPNSHDIKTLSECVMLLRQVKNKLTQKARHVKDDLVVGYLGETAALIENRAIRFEQSIEKMKKEQSNEPS